MLEEEFRKYTTRRTQDTSVCGSLLFIISSTDPGVQTMTAPNSDDEYDFTNIPMDNIHERDELEEFLAQPIEDVCNPLKWWWEHHEAFPCLSAMAFNYLSVPGKVEYSS